MPENIAGGIVSKIGEYVVDLTVKQGHYLCCLKSIVKDLEKEETNLKSVQQRMENKVECAKNNNETIYEDAEKWLKDTSNILEEVRKLKGEIEVKKSCLNGWCPNLGCRYWLGRKAAKKTSILLKKIDEYGKIEIVGHPAPLPGIEFSAAKDFEPFQSSKVAFDQIIEALRNDETSLVGLYGMGGSGKTTLAKEVGIEVKKKGIFNEVVMAVVSQAPNFKDIQRKLADSLGVELKEEDDIEKRAKQLYLRLTKTNMETKKKSLVILDDIWKKFDLKSTIGFPFDEENKHCKILLTTRRQQLCTDIGCQLKIPLNLLNEAEGLTLLKRNASINDNSCTSELKALAIEIARECRGLPLAIATVGSVLKEKSIDEWNVVLQKLKASKLDEAFKLIDADVGEDKDIYACLKVSYDYLRDEETKFCFLLCSLFPEDYEIPFEYLISCGIGLGLFPDTNSIEEARIRLSVMLNSLKASSLLLDGDEGSVKLHDMVRDVALWIASKGKNLFMSRSDQGQMKRSNKEGWEQYTGVCLLSDKTEECPINVVCPKLEILILGGDDDELEISDECFLDMKALKVLILLDVDLSVKSLQFLTNLKTLFLIRCNIRDISYIGKLNKLEILQLQHSSLEELPIELSELCELRWLEFDEEWMRIPSNFTPRWSQLEELRLSLKIDATCLPKDFALPRLQRHEICVNTGRSESSYKRILKISDIEATSVLTAFKELYGNLEDLHLEETIGCQNILPSIDEGGLNELKFLELGNCGDLQCILDTSQQHMPADAFQNLVKLRLADLVVLKEICNGGRLPKGFLQNLETVYVNRCPDVCCLFPTELLSRLRKLKEVRISSCEKLQELFQFQTNGKENDLMLLPSLTELELKDLPRLKYLWKGPTHQVNLQCLTSLFIYSCERLEYVFPISIARGLIQLEQLTIRQVDGLKQVFFADNGSEEIVAERDGKDIRLPKLKEITLDTLESLTNFLPNDCRSTWPALEVLELSNCSNLATSFISQVNIQDQRLRILKIEDCHHQLCDDLILAYLRDGFKNLEKLTIKNCAVKVVFQLESLALVTDRQPHELLLSNLKELKLESLTELKGLCKGPIRILTLHNLTKAYVRKCHKLSNLFSSTLAKSLLQLRELTIVECKELEQIIFKDDEDGVDEMNGKEIVLLPVLKELSLTALPKLTNFCPMGFILKLGVLNLQNLTEVYISKCHKMRNLFSSTLAQYLLQLKRLTIEECEELERIIFKDDDEGGDKINGKEIILLPQLEQLSLKALSKLTSFCPASFILKLGVSSLQNLTEVYVTNCHKMRNLFSSTLAQYLLQLKRLTIKECEELERIIFKDDEEGGDEINGKEIILLPQLEELSLEALPKLTSFYPAGFIQKLGVSSLQNLADVHVSKCHKMRNLFSSTLARYLLQLKRLTIEKCEELERIIFKDDEEGGDEINGQEIILLPQLEELSLEALPKLTSFCPAGFVLKLGVSSLQNLADVHVSKCRKMRNLFSSTLARYILQLKRLTIEMCEEFERIIFKDDEEGGDEINGQEIILLPQLEELSLEALSKLTSICPAGFVLKLGVSSLQNLADVHVSKCHKMRNIFSSTRARYLLQLKRLTIEKCEELERIIFKDDEEGGDEINGQEIILLPQLEELSLEALPKLTSFCPAGFVLKLGVSSLQNLADVHVSKCHKMRNLFSSTLARYLLQLKRLTIEKCEELERIIFKDDEEGGDEINGQEIILMPQLEELSLKALPKLTSFCPAGFVLNLKTLRVEGFKDEQMWVQIVSCLSDVKILNIRDCGVKELKGLSKSTTHILTLQNLTSLSLWNCRKLRHIVVSNLSQLQYLRIGDCVQLEEINIVEDKENDVQPGLIHKDKDRPADDVRSYHKQLELPQLQYLYLDSLPSLTKFCPVNYHLIFPSLEELYVLRSGKIKTKFWYCNRGENGKGSVLAEGKPPEDDEDPQQGDIKCWNSKAMMRDLPLFEHNQQKE